MADKSVTLLCAASGTGLSKIAEKLGEIVEGSVVGDLESKLCAGCLGDRRLTNPTQVPSMANVIEKLPRVELYEKWGESVDVLFAEQLQRRDSSVRMLALHLTWHNSDTGEFFSPIDYKKLDHPRISIDRVVILIDDIYDMLARLQENGSLYSERRLQTQGKLLSRLSNIPGTEYEDLDVTGKERLTLEALEVALAHLISWRRAEMIQAENLARLLDAEFTVFGVKHSWDAFLSLVSTEPTPKTYLSHKISEIRRMNKSTSELPDDLGTWSATTNEVNALHQAFANRGQVLINPTAIDELRFGDTSDDGGRSTYLARRWPLPEPQDRLLWLPPNGQYEEYTKILLGKLNPPEPIASSVSRSLSNKIYFDVAFRDHVIVELADNLCVYRPFFHEENLESGKGADWSGGVKPEIRHWVKKPREGGTGTPRLAYVHTREEIKARIEFLKENRPICRKFCNEVTSHLGRLMHKLGIPKEDRDLFFSGSVKSEPTHLGANPQSTIETNAAEIISYVETVSTAALNSLFSIEKDLEEDLETQDRSILRLVASEEDGRCVASLDGIVEVLCAFYSGDMDDDDIDRLNDEFADTVEQILVQTESKTSEAFVAELTEIPLEELQKL